MRRIAALALALACVLTPGCDGDSPTGPTTSDMTGTWTGTGTYPNMPFRLVLTQTGTTLRGEYSDQLDRSLSVGGTVTFPTFAIVIDFGDAKLNITGTVVTARQAEGSMFTSALGNRLYPFTMTR